MNITRALPALLLCALAGPTAAEEMKPGLWEITTSMKMQGMEIPGMKMKHCYTAKDIADNKQHKMDDKDNKCTLSNFKRSGGSYSFDFACTSREGKTTGSAKGSTSATAYSTEMKMRMNPAPQPGMGEMTQTIKGKRVGDCK